MNKTVKKLDNNVVKALTLVCEHAKVHIPGFLWLTHNADYANFPGSLVVTCVFENQLSLNEAKQTDDDQKLIKLIGQKLLKAGILLKKAKHHVRFDSEEAGAAERLL